MRETPPEPARVEIGAPVPYSPDELPLETPLSAADPTTARLLGGRLTRAALDALPADFAGLRVVLDSALVWLPRGFAACPGEWAWERALHGAEAGALDPPEARVMQVVFSPVSALALLDGSIEPGWATLGMPGPESRFPGGWAHAARARAAEVLEPAIAAGRLVERVARPGAPAVFPGLTFRRITQATDAGFCFSVRCVAGSPRPYANVARRSARVALY